MSELRQIVWIASYPKSGNTWVRLFLDAYFLGELDINEIITSIGDDGVDRYSIYPGFETWQAPVDIQQLIRGTAMLRTVLAYNETPHGDLPLLVKTHQANMVANGVELLPAALTRATVHIVRDPRDVLPSMANHMGVSLDQAADQLTNRYQLLAAAPGRVADFLSSWVWHTNAYMAADEHNTLTIRYEDLRADPRETFAKILRHIGTRPDMDKVDTAIEMTELSKLRAKEEKEGFYESSRKATDPFFNTGQVGKKLPAHIKARIERECRKTMLHLGYLGKRKADGIIQLH